MASQVLLILRQGVWAALTGGWYHDPSDSEFNNTCHLYLWMFLLLLPLGMHLGLPPTLFTLCLYCSFTTIFFTSIKFVSYRLHLMFDKGIDTYHKKNEAKRKEEEGSSSISVNHTPVSSNAEDVGEDSVQQDLTQSNQSSEKWHESNGSNSVDSMVLPPKVSCEDLKENASATKNDGNALKGEYKESAVFNSSKSHVKEEGYNEDRGDCLKAENKQEVIAHSVGSNIPEQIPNANAPIKILVTMNSESNTSIDQDGSLYLKVLSKDNMIFLCDSGINLVDNQNLKQIISKLKIESSCESNNYTVLQQQQSPDCLNINTSCTPCSGYELSKQDNSAISNTTAKASNIVINRRVPLLQVRDSDIDYNTGNNLLMSTILKEYPHSSSSCGSNTCEKRHNRVLSMDSRSDDTLTKNCIRVSKEQRKALPTSKSDLEGKGGQVPNESNFIEFVSLLESINTSKVPGSNILQKDIKGDHGLQNITFTFLNDTTAMERKARELENENNCESNSEKTAPLEQSEHSDSSNKEVSESAKCSSHYQGCKERKINYQVTRENPSQQDSSVFQVVSGSEASMLAGRCVDAMHLYIDNHGEVKSCVLKAGSFSEGYYRKANPDDNSLEDDTELSSSAGMTTSESQGPFSGDAEAKSGQQQVPVMIEIISHAKTPEPSPEAAEKRSYVKLLLPAPSVMAEGRPSAERSFTVYIQ